ncbi:bifunctional riboflavin kinase/FAD synthetase [Paenibacillus sp. OAS669]|uniref:bifunctional riboflavin kinase/FAD synthetase n=1 Tax=Paenibacillus sp. OAS669 TaxID=2663821 RepID=UPI00178B1EC7|nr:bifunctional riboflavin kinase/FAD synthetase [Paenibacillus sp. OAS669]MBE1446450.1 riboflavin kinase/FMN adenylyltransferase [Paenibacillus sp. OAS669]
MQSIHLNYPIVEGKDSIATVPQVLAIGEFDGIHLGHQEVIKRALQTAKNMHIPASIMTFHPHPKEVLGQHKYTQLLTPANEKERILAGMGLDNSYLVAFDSEFMKVTPEQFVENMLIPMNVNTVIVGFDFTFGFRGAGTPDTLCELAAGRFAVEVIRPFLLNGSKVSSTLVREYLQSGQLEEANLLLGRPYTITGTVVTGDGRGRTIGFPTANIEMSESFVIPTLGVYAAKVIVDGEVHHAVMNVGKKPTFVEHLDKPTLEAHLFDFSRSIYGSSVTVEFISFLRPERKFGSVDELITQIRSDADRARTILAEKYS